MTGPSRIRRRWRPWGLGLAAWLLLLTASPALPAPGLSSGYLETFQSVPTTSPPRSDGQAYRVYHLEFRSPSAAARFTLPEVHVFHRNGRFVDLFAPPTDAVLEAIAASPDLVWLDANRMVDLPPPPQGQRTSPTRVEPERVARGGVDGWTGRGVTIALIDSGFDVRHPDFQVLDAEGRPRTRFRWIWDTTATRTEWGQDAPLRYPDGQPIGVLYHRDQIDAYLATPEAQRPPILWDGNGHGTACAGIAAGNGRALPGQPYAGVASEADLIGIRLGDQAENTYLASALFAWLDREAGPHPLVISNSWGGHRSGHDGQSLVERQIDDLFPPDRPGRLVLFAAGNEGRDRLHSAGDFVGPDRPGLLRLPAAGPDDPVEVTVYFDSDDPSLSVDPPWERLAFLHGLTGQMVWRLAPAESAQTLSLFSATGRPGHFDAYIAGQIGEEPALFDEEVAVFGELVNQPGTAAHVLTVGSYDFHPYFEREGQKLTLGVGEGPSPMTPGDISSYSSPGWTRLGQLKPDLVAPGQWWTAAAPLEPSPDRIADTSGRYQLFNGTSAATPYAAGVFALLLERQPRLTLAQVRVLLDRHLREDAYTGPLPNPLWGRGKLTLSAVEAMLGEVGRPEGEGNDPPVHR